MKCGKRFTTYERFEQTDLWVIKKNGQREKFERLKLEKGVMKAFEKRAVSKEKIEQMINSIEENLRKRGKEIKSSVIGRLVMKGIKKLDNVAYIRFASVYKDFQDANDFKEAIKETK